MCPQLIRTWESLFLVTLFPNLEMHSSRSHETSPIRRFFDYADNDSVPPTPVLTTSFPHSLFLFLTFPGLSFSLKAISITKLCLGFAPHSSFIYGGLWE